MRGRARPVVLAVAALVATALVVGIFVLVTRRPAPGPGQGIIGRSAAAPPGVDFEPHGLDDPCFSGYQVERAGRDAANLPHLGLSMKLKVAPADAGALSALLAQPGCRTDLQRLVSGLVGKGKPAGSDGLTLSYVTPAGARLLLP